MKKLLSLIISVVLLLTIVMTPVYASSPDGELWLYTDDCPVEALEYAQERFLPHLISSVEGDSLNVGETISLGQPFKIMSNEAVINMYYFPVISDGTIIGTLRVYQTAEDPVEYAAITSQYLGRELQELRSCTSQNAPALLYMDNGNVMAQANGESRLLSSTPESGDPQGTAIPMTESTSICVTSAIQSVSSTDLISPTANSKYLNLSIIETQGSNNWCAAYVTAAIIRYCTKNNSYPTALDIMKKFTPIQHQRNLCHVAK